MLSSTSNSRYRRGHGVFYFGWFLATTLATGTIVHVAWKSTALARHVVLETIAPALPSADFYLAVTDQDAIDGYVFLHELENVCEPIRAADIIFFGDSRLQFALRGQTLRRFLDEHGLRFYLLGFPNGSDQIAQAILKRCRAHPRLAVVMETGFFRGQATGFDKRMLAASAFDAIKARMEFEWAFAARRRLHRILPHPVGRDLLGGSWILYRSRLDGSWRVAAGSQRDFLVRRGPAGRVQVPAVESQAAERFRDTIRAGGGKLVLAYVPSRLQARARAHTIAAYLGVPIVDPDLDGLHSADGVHLQKESAERYTRAFTRLLERFLPRPGPASRSPAPQNGAKTDRKARMES